MNLLNLIGLLSGLALFLYGISLMRDGLGKAAGDRVKKMLYRQVGNPIRGILLGIAVTELLLSSSAASVMVVGFVNSGLMQFTEAVSILLGSIVGTSVTGWIVSLSSLNQSEGILMIFSSAFITGMLAVIGIFLYKFSKKPLHHHIGSVLLGLAVLLFGMSAMSDAVIPLKENAELIALLTRLSNPLLGILIGILFTALIRSSAAAVGILQALSMTGILRFAETYPVLLGIAVGGALPVLVNAAGASLNARRTALVHLIIDLFGAAFCGLVFYAIHAAHPFSFLTAAMSPARIAALNTLFRTVTAVLLAPMIASLGKLVNLILKGAPEQAQKSEASGDWDLLDERFLPNPTIAIEQSRMAVCSMAAHVRENLEKAILLIHQYSDEGFQAVQTLEETVDRYEDRIGTYLIKVSSSELTTRQNEDLYRFLHAITDLERISDHATNISENAKELHDKQIEWSTDAGKELLVMQAAVEEVLELAIRALTERDVRSAHMVEPLEAWIDDLCKELKLRHVERLQKGRCILEHGFVFNDLLTNYERISDHCSNIAVALIELEKNAFDTHDYIERLMAQKDEEFDQYFNYFKEKYALKERSC